MTFRYRLFLFLLALLLFVAVGRIITGSFGFMMADFWFTSGVLLLILLSLIDQPHFSKDTNVFVNGVTGLTALMTVMPLSRNRMWDLFFAWSFYLVASSYVIMMLRRRELTAEPIWLRVFSRVNHEIGRPEPLFSAFFIWGLLTQFGADSHEFRALTLFWGVYIVANIPAIARALDFAFSRAPTMDESAVGLLQGITSPRIVEVRLRADAPRPLVGRHATITCGSHGICAHATFIDDRIMSRLRLGKMAVTSTTDQWERLADESMHSSGVIHLGPDSPAELPISVVDKGSDIGTLRFYTNPEITMQEGEVIWTRLPSGQRAYYQIVAAQITEEVLESPHSAQNVLVSAGQLGIWNPENCRFEPIQWVAPAGELIFRIAADTDIEGTVPEQSVQVGSVPNAAFPVHVSLQDVVTHNSAILGVTGSGKSYLCFRLVEALAAAGIKVMILDLTRQHWVFLTALKPTALRKPDEVAKWLGEESMLGIYQFAESTSHPASTAAFVESAFKYFVSSVKLRAGENEPARLCIVLEEAHSLVPEWNQVASKDDSAYVNRTARFMLQGRKYGLGCILISQRTANVTKTILNQCNTIFAMQSFDQTGLDFLKNYMGEAYAHAISTLPARQAVLVGKASSSARPILFAVENLSSRWTNGSPQVAAQELGA
jgi:uncharacterized protein